ncbi:protein ABHD15-like [Diadema setosum]|uniref:protein ABHD15-like n=1 Tax=Diadema setosum TaxID=31175 RepID=UPI003B3BB620
MQAVRASAAAYYSEAVGAIMSVVFHGTPSTELAYSQTDTLCASNCESRQTWCLPDMQGGPKEPSPVNNVPRSFLTLLVEWLTLCCTLMTLFLRWFWRCGTRMKEPPPLPHLNFRSSSLLKYVLKTCHALREPFVPLKWIRFGHLHTILACILCDSTVCYRREILQMADGGIVALDWADTRRQNDKCKPRTTVKGIVIVLPNITASCGGVARLCLDICRHGYEPVVFQPRGTSGLPLTAPKIQSLGDTSDLREVVRYLKSKYSPRKRICAVGLGYGGSLLLSYLGNYGSSSRLSAAVCVSPVYDLQSAIHETPGPSILNWIVLQLLKWSFTRHVNAMPQKFDLDSAFSSRTLSEWLQAVHCPMYKLKDLDEYWEHNEPLREADEIAVPLLCINSLDDPFTRKGNIPFDLFSTLPNLLLVTTEKGGHCGFFGNSFSPNSWAHNVSLDFISAVLQFTDNLTKERNISGRIRVDS